MRFTAASDKPPNCCQDFACVAMEDDETFEIHRDQIDEYRCIFDGSFSVSGVL
jgi:hypothetical protein